jgi:hypothetical protein
MTLRTHCVPAPEIKEPPGAELFVAEGRGSMCLAGFGRTCSESVPEPWRNGNRAGKQALWRPRSLN